MPLADTASAIRRHLDRFATDKSIAERDCTDGKGEARTLTLYWHPTCWRAGPRVKVKYVSYQGESSLTRLEAEAYLAWLDAGNVGRHYEAVKPHAKVN